MKRSTFRVLFYLKRDKEKKDGSVPLFCRITVDGKEVRFGMKRDINPKYWDLKSGKATGRSEEAVEINTLIDNTKTGIFKVYREMQERENCVTAEKVKNAFLGVNGGHITLLSFFDEINQKKKALVGKNLSRATYDRYCLVRKHLAEFLSQDCHLSDISLKEIDYRFVCNFERFLVVSHRCNDNTTIRYLHQFKHVIITAMKFGLIYKSPFADYQFKVKKSNRGFLTQEEVETLMTHKFKSRRLERVRDMFIFCCFTGLSYIDVKNLSEDMICTLFDKPWIIGKRGKTDVAFQVPLMEVPKKILEKYKGTLPDNRLLPIARNRKENLSMRDVCEQCGINKRVTFHMARHTFATLTLSKGVSIESVSKMLGHTNIQTTQIYAKITPQKIRDDMALFAERVSGIELKLAVNF